MSVATRRWSDLTPRTKRLLVLGSVVDGALKLAALIDLARRPAARINGRKWAWATVLTLVNSVGVAPLAYFRFGRK
jgi:hypothetical protein